MAYREDHPHSPESHPQQYAMVDGTAPPGDALIAQTNGHAGPGAIVPAMPVHMPQDVLRGGMDANTFLHALRRRWMLALCMGLVAGSATAFGLWLLFPQSTTAVALFQVASQAEAIYSDINRQNEQKFETLQKTHLALLRSHFVLQRAINNPGVSSLSVLAGVGDPIIWLQDNLRVEFPQQSEILSISLSSDAPPEELRQLVDAVAKEYEQEVVHNERQRKLTTLDHLTRALIGVQRDLENKMNQFYTEAQELGYSDAYEGNAMTNLLLAQMNDLHRQRSELERQLNEASLAFQIGKMRFENPQLMEAQVDAMLAQDPTIASLQQQVMFLQMKLSQDGIVAKGGRSREITRTEQKIAQMQQQIAQQRAHAKQQMMSTQSSNPNDAAKRQWMKESSVQIRFMQQRFAAIRQAYDEKLEELQQKVAKSVDLERRRAELDQLTNLADDMSIKRESLVIERDAPARIIPIQPAVPTPDLNMAQRVTIASLGGLCALGLVCFGIGYLEFRNRRLNGPDEVDEGLGIRVVGTLPSLASRGALDPTHPIVAQLTESIDSVRTILMHDSTMKKRQVVLVSSATAMEGRTTVASQLAASLARAGRRTLLVDGDLRRPALHSLFDVPLEDGLCEVLRAEVDAADVIRPTHAEGLWLLTAGYCDVDAIHALATEQMQPVFDKLRAEYDFIIIDGAPIIGMSDALIFGQYSDGAILSVRRDFSQMPKINQAAELLRGVGIRIIGSVVNGVPTKADDRITQLRLIAPKAEREELQPTA